MPGYLQAVLKRFKDPHNKRASGFITQRLGRVSGGDGGETNSAGTGDKYVSVDG
jgi:hypothetical protein